MASVGRGARQKGFQFERDISKALTASTGFAFKRGLGQTRGGGAETADVIPEDLWLKEQMHIECKRQKSVSIKAAMKQALDDVVGTSKVPIAITKEDRKTCFATLRVKDFVQLTAHKTFKVESPEALVTLAFEDFEPIFSSWVSYLMDVQEN